VSVWEGFFPTMASQCSVGRRIVRSESVGQVCRVQSTIVVFMRKESRAGQVVVPPCLPSLDIAHEAVCDGDEGARNVARVAAAVVQHTSPEDKGRMAGGTTFAPACAWY